MQEQDEARAVDRRRLLRRAGTIAVGAAGVTAASAIVSAPAQAASTPVVTEQPNIGGDADTPTVRLENPAAGGAALSVSQSDPDVTAPAGSIFVDKVGDIATVAEDAAGRYVTYLYSPTWASMVVPIRPLRWLDTRNSAGRAHIVAGSVTFDASGRVKPKYSNTVPDLKLDLSDLFAGGYGALQANLTVVSPANSGWAAIWDAGTFPGTSSINYGTALPALSNYVQTPIAETPITGGTRRFVSLKTNQPVHLIVDIVGFVVADPFAQLSGAAASAGATTLGTASADGGSQPLRKRRPPTR
ncbi:MAG TPA: hypothetical protein VHN18_03805 [Micromonosporaceae bacterium]|nr:hypothetical protein [Micromonosporaceae bacterium]